MADVVTIVPYARETKNPLAASLTLRTGPRPARAQGTMVTAGLDSEPFLLAAPPVCGEWRTKGLGQTGVRGRRLSRHAPGG
jgi:hypothetical protein